MTDAGSEEVASIGHRSSVDPKKILNEDLPKISEISLRVKSPDNSKINGEPDNFTIA